VKCECYSHGGFLMAKGLREAAQRRLALPEVDAMESSLYLDIPGSVSGLELERDLYADILDSSIDEQARRFQHGC